MSTKSEGSELANRVTRAETPSTTGLKSPRRVLHVCKVYLPTQGGVQMVIHRICKGLTQSLWQFSVLTTSERLGDSASHDQVSVKRAFSLGDVFSMPIAPGIVFRLRGLAKRHDLVCIHYPFPLADLASLFVRSRQTPIIVYWHSEIVSQKLSSILVRPLTSWMLRRCAAVVVSSPALVAHSSLLQRHKKKCVTIPFGMPQSAIESQPAPSSPSRCHYFVAVGRHVPYKGFDVLINAFAMAMTETGDSDTELVIVGGGPLLSDHQELADSLGISARIQFETDANDQQVANLIRDSRCLVLPSTMPSEAFALVQVEAMIHGRPIINTSLASGVPWVARHEVEALTVTPGDVLELASAMLKITQQDSLVDALGQRAKLRADTTFNYQNFCRATEDLYRAVIQGEYVRKS